jgi:hypothetical protein
MPINLSPNTFHADPKLESRSWFNTYGGFIIETEFDPSNCKYKTIYHEYNVETPNMPSK